MSDSKTRNNRPLLTLLAQKKPVHLLKRSGTSREKRVFDLWDMEPGPKANALQLSAGIPVRSAVEFGSLCGKGALPPSGNTQGTALEKLHRECAADSSKLHALKLKKKNIEIQRKKLVRDITTLNTVNALEIELGRLKSENTALVEKVRKYRYRSIVLGGRKAYRLKKPQGEIDTPPCSDGDDSDFARAERRKRLPLAPQPIKKVVTADVHVTHINDFFRRKIQENAAPLQTPAARS